MPAAVVLFLVALLASAFGAMVGLGGGFILVPVLRLLFGLAPAEAAGTSLILIVASGASGAFSYLMQRRVHLKIGWLIAAGGLPGGIIGAILSLHISPRAFDWILALLLIAVAIDMAWNAERRMRDRPRHERIHEIKGMSYRGALVLGFVIGIFSSLFGIGGGVVLVPTLLYFSELPIHAVSATSQFGILLTSPVGLVVHALQRDVELGDVVPLVAGGLLGGPIGARLSAKLRSPQLLIVVAFALVAVAGSLIWRHLK
ncbi:MAG TPA: sulfite exporter TauE/SafE family protein [Candidatus Tumulicola sp.]